MLQLGVIEETDSAYASPIVVVAKPNGDVRVCTDYRSLNKITEFDPYPIPQIEQILDEVAQAKFITTLDLTKGFYQVPLDMCKLRQNQHSSHHLDIFITMLCHLG
jgi:hypothetical protein